ncbi:flippase-like domain-containing protein [Candidatus Woesearchaeota archaeon]|nr:flippase-like domain-containing protein [Candidatus Woesearchaeota archaeon]MBW3017128.1 flippase-like domain-containing protein [Candidatus Woesearchaeota archaeon]
MKALTKRVLVLASLLLGLGLFVYVFMQNKGIFGLFAKLDYYYLIPYAIFSFSVMLVHVLRWRLISYAHNINTGFWRLVIYKCSGYAISYLTPSAHIGGEPVRAWLMKTDKIRFSNALSSVILDKYIEITANIVMGSIGFIILIVNITIARNTFLIVTLALVLSALALFYFYKRIASGRPFLSLLLKPINYKRLNKFKKQVVRSEKLMSKFFVHKTRYLFAAFSMSFACYFLMFFEFFFLLKAFGFTPNFSQIFMVVAIIAITFILPVPAALGLLEAGQTGLFSFMAFNPLIGFGLSLVVRLRDLIITGVGFTYLLQRSFKFLGFFKK